MRTVDKALKLMEQFTDRRAEIGLSEMARLAGLDKATTLRMATVLRKHGYLEQHPVTKAYRLGAGLLRLARLREACFPVQAVVDPVLRDLAEETGETAHASLLAGENLVTIGTAEPDRANRVHVEPGLILPFHATASGLVFLAFGTPSVADKILAAPLQRFTDKTDCDVASLRMRMATIVKSGVAYSDMGYEAEVCSTAAPLFSTNAEVCGAVTVAAPASRMNAQARAAITAAVLHASALITEGLGGEPSPAFSAAVERAAA